MRIVIIGAGPAGVTVAETIRRYDRESQVTMLSSEPYPPYSPPAMIEYFLSGRPAHLWKGDKFPERLGIEYRSGVRVTGIDADAHKITLESGEELGYDRLVIATGSRLYAPVEGADREGVYNFKSLSAAESMISRVRSGDVKTAVIVGAGFIGMEIALLLAGLGLKVIQVAMMDQVMPRMLDPEVAAIVLNVMRERGIDVRLNTKADAFIGDGHAEGVRLENGSELQADIMVAATGVTPNINFLDGTGIELDGGVVVDEHLRSSAPDIYAAGDVTSTPDIITGERFVHPIFPNAVAQGEVVGLNLIGYDVTYPGAEAMNSLKHLGLPVIAAGVRDADEVIRLRRGEMLRKVFIRENRIVGFQIVGDTRPAGLLRSMMRRGINISRLKHRLADPSFGMGTVEWMAIRPDL